MFGTSTFIYIGIMAAIGISLPVAVSIWWLRTRREKITTVLTGAATWFVFAMILETIVHIIVSKVFPAVFENTISYTIYGALMAGLFEETGRLVAFKTVLRKRTNRETAISHGIGHGGFEALLLLGYAGIQYLAYAMIINQGKLQMLIDEVEKAGGDASSVKALPEQIAAITPGYVAMGVCERVFAMLLHVGLSILVFYAVKKSRTSLYILAIALHALFDVPAALYQCGILTLPVVEAILAIYSIVFFVTVYKMLYKKDFGNGNKSSELNSAVDTKVSGTPEEVSGNA
jgi:uncharacterized membrane protein YhfC